VLPRNFYICEAVDLPFSCLLNTEIFPLRGHSASKSFVRSESVSLFLPVLCIFFWPFDAYKFIRILYLEHICRLDSFL
jgi:hypothetical protein